MSKHRTFEIHDLDGKVWVRPYEGDTEFNGETFDTLGDAKAALPDMAIDLGWATEYYVTGL